MSVRRRQPHREQEQRQKRRRQNGEENPDEIVTMASMATSGRPRPVATKLFKVIVALSFLGRNVPAATVGKIPSTVGNLAAVTGTDPMPHAYASTGELPNEAEAYSVKTDVTALSGEAGMDPRFESSLERTAVARRRKERETESFERCWLGADGKQICQANVFFFGMSKCGTGYGDLR